MPMARSSAACRALALILLLSFSLFGLEGEVADVHDADAETSQAAVFRGDPSENAAPSQSSAPTQPQDNHAFHVCHCAHSHGGLVLTTPDPTSAVVQACREEFELPAEPASLRVPPPLRPPIA